MKPETVFGLEHAAWPALLVDAGGGVLLTNQAAKDVFGAALVSGFSSIWSPDNSGTASEFLSRWEQSPAAGILKFRLANGSTGNFNTAICAFNGEDKKCFVMQLFPDPAEPDGKAAGGDSVLKQKLDCVLQLARTMSLDFNNALTGVLAHTSLLLGKAEKDHPWRRSLLEVEKSAARAAEIAGELAQFSRQEKETKRAPAGNLNAVVNRCVDFFQNKNNGRINWKVNLERSLFVSRFDETKIQQALMKVLENAVEAFGLSAMGQVSVQTRNVELTEPTQDRNVKLTAGTYVCAEIADNGCGIDAGSLPKIFEPFFTTKRPPHRGLGLALVYGMISNHGGGVAISSQQGVGTSVRIYLPAENTYVADSGGGSTELRGSGTVLFVDDENIVLTMAETILSDYGYKVQTANNGQKALTMLNQPGSKIDLVITDLVMPGMGGRELTEKIRQQFPGLPVMPTSGYVMPDDKKGAVGYLQKPFTSTELLRKVKAAIAPNG